MAWGYPELMMKLFKQLLIEISLDDALDDALDFLQDDDDAPSKQTPKPVSKPALTDSDDSKNLSSSSRPRSRGSIGYLVNSQ